MIRFERTSPMQTGEAYRAMQAALNAAGYTDADGWRLDEDGKWGSRSQQAFDAMISAHAPDVAAPAPVTEQPVAVFRAEDGGYELWLVKEAR